MTPQESTLLIRSDDERGVTTLTLNRPAAFNALSEDLLTALQCELDELSKNQKVIEPIHFLKHK